jgi:hypothetical protein
LTKAVRNQVGLGRVLPLGGPEEGIWVTEHAAALFLRRAASSSAVGGGLRLGALRIGLAAATGPVLTAGAPPPPGALPRRPLRVDAAFEASPDRPLPDMADRLRRALSDAAREGIGLDIEAVDLLVTGLLDEGTPAPAPVPAPAPAVAEPTPDGPSVPAAAAVPGVAGLTSRLGGFGFGVQIAVSAGYRPLNVARAVRAATGLPVVVTGIG